MVFLATLASLTSTSAILTCSNGCERSFGEHADVGMRSSIDRTLVSGSSYVITANDAELFASSRWIQVLQKRTRPNPAPRKPPDFKGPELSDE